MLRMSRIFNFLKKKDPIFRKIRENFGNVQIIQKIIQNYSVVSLGVTETDVVSRSHALAAPLDAAAGAEGAAPRTPVRFLALLSTSLIWGT